MKNESQELISLKKKLTIISANFHICTESPLTKLQYSRMNEIFAYEVFFPGEKRFYSH